MSEKKYLDNLEIYQNAQFVYQNIIGLMHVQDINNNEDNNINEKVWTKEKKKRYNYLF